VVFQSIKIFHKKKTYKTVNKNLNKIGNVKISRNQFNDYFINNPNRNQLKAKMIHFSASL
jgi:hypothetical protein